MSDQLTLLVAPLLKRRWMASAEGVRSGCRGPMTPRAWSTTVRTRLNAGMDTRSGTSTCPPSSAAAARDTIKIARLAKETGLFPVFEAEHGEVVSVSKIRRQVPVEEYLGLQRRYAHLFGDPPRTDVVERIQAGADRNIRRFGLLQNEPGKQESDLMRLLAETDRGPQ